MSLHQGFEAIDFAEAATFRDRLPVAPVGLFQKFSDPFTRDSINQLGIPCPAPQLLQILFPD